MSRTIAAAKFRMTCLKHSVLSACALFTVAASAEEAAPSWDVANPPGAPREVRIDVDEGSWMGLDVAPDGKTIVFELLGDLYLLPIGGGEAKPIASGHAWDMQPRYSPDGSKIAFTSDRGGGDNIWVMNADGSDKRAVTKEDFRLPANAAWTPDGQYIAARKHYTTERSDGTGEIWLYHVSGGKGMALVERPSPRHQKDINDPEFSPDGRYLYYDMDTTPGEIFQYAADAIGQIFEIMRYDMHTGKSEAFVSGAGGSARPTISPDGRYMAFTRRVLFETHLFVKDMRSGEERSVYSKLDPDLQDIWSIYGVYPHMAWTPDSRSIVFWAGGKIRRLDRRSGEVTEIPFRVKDTRTVYEPPRRTVDVAPDTFSTKMVRFATVSPDGERVVFESLGRLYIKELPNGAPRRLTRDGDDHFELFPSWSRDGRWIVFATWDDERLGSVRKVRASGGRSSAITQEPGHYADPRFSPDGRTVVFSRRKGGRLTAPEWSIEPGIYVADAGGGPSRLVTRSGADAHFGKDNDRLFLTRGGREERKLVSVDLNGADLREHATATHATRFAVSPDESHLAFREYYQVHALPFPKAGKAVKVGPKEDGFPIVRASGDGGNYPHFADGRLYWSLGPTLFSARTGSIFKADYAAPETGISLSQTVTAAKPGGRVALTGARVVTMSADDGGVIENGVVLINGNRIEAVGGSDLDIPAGSKRVDMAGKTIIPGLIDVHAHGPHGTGDLIPEQNWESHAMLALGVTTLHDPSNDSTEIFAAAEYQQAGRILAPRTFSTGHIIYGARSQSLAPIETYEDALRHVRRLKAQGAISVKNYNQPRREQRQMVIQAGRDENMLVIAEGGAIFHFDMAYLADGTTGIEHNPPPRHMYEDILQFWAATKVSYTPTTNVTFGGQQGENWWYQESDVWKHPLLSKYVPPKVLQPRSVRRLMSPLEDHGHVDSARNLKKLFDRGVSVHTGAHGQREGLGTHWDMWTYVLGGLTPVEAIRTATIQPARYLGMDKDVGSIEAGKLADLVVIDGNPVADIRQTDDIAMVMLNGRLYDAATLDETVTGDWDTRPYFWTRPAVNAR